MFYVLIKKACDLLLMLLRCVAAAADAAAAVEAFALVVSFACAPGLPLPASASLAAALKNWSSNILINDLAKLMLPLQLIPCT